MQPANVRTIGAPLLLAVLLCLSLAYAPQPALAACEAGHFCYADAITIDDQITCALGMYCPGGQSGQICPKGNFCPSTTQLIECPSGYYCPPGSISPRPCSPLASCPAGSERYFHFGTLILLALLLPLILTLKPIYDRVNRFLRTREESVSAVSGRKSVVGIESGVELASPYSPDRSPSPATVELAKVPRMDIRFDHLEAAIVDSAGIDKTILGDVSGHFRSGRLIAVMGPSGAGKSSLINVLTGSVKLKSGSVETRIEGGLQNDLKKARRQGMIGVVPQADIMLAALTPRDILTHSAYTRLPASWTREQKDARVTETLRALNLEKVQHTPVGDEDVRGISGGEKKRVNIGIEMCCSPSLLILDEPTTGLDATSSASLLVTLREISKMNTTVVAVLHQPRNEIFRALDDLLLLAPGGRTVYFGPARQAQAYFERIGYVCDSNTNPADFFIDCIAGKAGSPFQASSSTSAAVAAGGGKDVPADGSQNTNAEILPSGATTPKTTAEIQSYIAGCWKDSYGDEARAQQNAEDPQVERSAEKDTATTYKSDVELPNALTLTYLYCYRGLLQLVRSVATIQLELFMHILAGLVIGMAFTNENWFIPPVAREYVQYCPGPMKDSCIQQAVRDANELMMVYTVMALGLVAAIIGNRCYGEEKLEMQRESSAGLASSSYFVGKALSELPLIVVYSFLYTVSYYLVASPNAKFNDFYTVILLLEYTMFGVGYVSSLLLTSENALLLSSIAALLGGLATQNDTVIKQICWSRWVAEALYVSELRFDLLTGPLYDTAVYYIDFRAKFVTDNFATCIGALIIYGTVLRLWCFFLVWRKFKSTQ